MRVAPAYAGQQAVGRGEQARALLTAAQVAPLHGRLAVEREALRHLRGMPRYVPPGAAASAKGGAPDPAWTDMAMVLTAEGSILMSLWNYAIWSAVCSS